MNDTIQKLCKKGLDGHLKVDDLIKSWPEKAKESPFYVQVYEDLEDAVEHLPGYFLKQGIQEKYWYDNSEVYLRLYLDHALMESEKTVDELARCRQEILSLEKLSRNLINQEIKKRLG